MNRKNNSSRTGSVKQKRGAQSRALVTSIRPTVRSILTSSPSFNMLPPDKRKDIAHDMVRVASYMVNPHGLLREEFHAPLLAGLVLSTANERRASLSALVPNTILVSSAATDHLIANIDFPDFVTKLIQGTFQAILTASIDQMDAYVKLMAAVSKSVDTFLRDKITERSAREALVREFPEVFCWTGKNGRALKWHPSAKSPSLQRLGAAIGLREPVSDSQNPGEVTRIVAAARRRLARNRQQLLVTMILMGINRIVVTNGSISSRVRR